MKHYGSYHRFVDCPSMELSLRIARRMGGWRCTCTCTCTDLALCGIRCGIKRAVLPSGRVTSVAHEAAGGRRA